MAAPPAALDLAYVGRAPRGLYARSRVAGQLSWLWTSQAEEEKL